MWDLILSALSFSFVSQRCVLARCFTTFFFSEELDLCRLWVQAGRKENFTFSAQPVHGWSEWRKIRDKNKRLMSGTGSASLASWVGTREEVKCIALEQNLPFAFGCDSNIIRFICCALLINFCAPTVYVKLVSCPVLTHKCPEAWNPLFSPSAGDIHFSPCYQPSFPFWQSHFYFLLLRLLLPLLLHQPFQLCPSACSPPPVPSSLETVGR